MKNQTDITFILDRSGSMGSVWADIIGGFNNFIKVQRETPAEIMCSLVQFDNEYERVFVSTPSKLVPDLTEKTYVPRGSTALYDAIGRAVKETGQRLAALKEEDRPNKVVIVTLTDGEENSSCEYSRQDVAATITCQQKNYSWEFVFIGSNQDAILSAGSIGIMATNAMTIAPTPDAYRHAFASAGSNVKLYACSATTDCSFTTAQNAIAKSQIDLHNQTKGN